MEMTSTSFNVGMNDARNSSRILKPPGGGHSDIFGIHDPKETRTPKIKNYNKSSISEVFGSIDQPDVNSNKKEKKTEEEQIVQPVQNENESPKPPIATSQRTRVPPGGFSSAFW